MIGTCPICKTEDEIRLYSSDDPTKMCQTCAFAKAIHAALLGATGTAIVIAELRNPDERSESEESEEKGKTQ